VPQTWVSYDTWEDMLQNTMKIMKVSHRVEKGLNRRTEEIQLYQTTISFYNPVVERYTSDNSAWPQLNTVGNWSLGASFYIHPTHKTVKCPRLEADIPTLWCCICSHVKKDVLLHY
jgi:hypothetical protein